MWSTIFVIAVAAGMGLVELPPLWKKRWRKEIAVYAVMLASGTALSIVAARLIALPSPFNAIMTVLKPLNDWLFP